MKTICLAILLFASGSILANVPGGGAGSGPNVSLVDNGNGTVTMSNGIVSLLITPADATITQINYSYNNGAGPTTTQLLNGGTDGGELYWETGGFGTGAFTGSIAANTGSYAEYSMVSTSATNGTMEVDFSMLPGSTGFYVTAIWSHRSTDSAISMGETRDNIYAGSIFNWMTVDAARNRLMEVSGGSAIGVLGAPVEVSLWTNGIYEGQYEDKYKYSANFGDQRVWGWSSVGPGGLNVGLWNISASMEYHNDGPMKRELMEHIGTTVLNMLNSTHYGAGVNDANWAAGEVWTKVNGPYFIYCNNTGNTTTNMTQASSALYADALAQAAAEETAWPYSWYPNPNYAQAAQRGTVSGTMVINDLYNPNASAAGLWVGVVQQPVTDDGMYDFQEWMKSYQFWVKTDTNGNFTIPNVIAGNNYTLYAFGPGSPGTFQSQSQSGGNSPNTFDLPASPFGVNVTGGATTNLGVVNWTPTRVGPTVFEIGYPDRQADKFRHGDDYWVGDIGPSPTLPSPIWSKHLEYPFDFPGGPNYVVGQSRWTTDWNYVQPIVVDSLGNLDNSSSTITFNLPSTPTNGAMASFYLALASDYQGAIIIQVNGTYITTSTGYYPNYSSSDAENDTTVRQGIHGAFSDARTAIPSGLLHAGQNTITIAIRQTGGTYFADHAMYDYARLQLAGYVPPAPASVTAYPGNNCNLVCWPVTPGATSYNVLGSTNSGGGYVSITNGVVGPVCGCGSNNATYLDTNAVNGATYYYIVQSVNSTGSSSNSPPSSGAAPSASLSATAPAAPTGLSVAGVGHQSVTLNWNATPGADFYIIQRSTVVNNGDNVYVALSTNTLNNTNTTTSYTDTSPTDGSIYSYSVMAVSAGGVSANSAPVVAVPLPAPPATAPGSLTGNFADGTNIVLSWSAVSGAVGYVISRATSPNGPFTLVMSVTETTYTDIGLNTNYAYYYQVAAVNAAGASGNAVATVLGPPTAPGLTAIPGNAQVSLSWSTPPGATNYVLQSSTTSGGPYTPILTTTNTSYVNTGLVNGTTYYYVIYSQGPNGQSPVSTQVGATPSLGASGIYWTNTVTTAAQNWNANANWDIGAFPNGAQAIAFVNSAIAGSQTIDLNQGITVGELSIGAGGGAFTLAPDGGTLTFDNVSEPALLTQLSVSQGDTISAPVTIADNLIVTNTSANTLTLSGNISGGGIAVNGDTTLSGTNSFTGGIVVNSGKLVFSAGSAIPAAGTLSLSNTASVAVTTANSLPNVLIGGANSITGNGNSGTGIATLADQGALTLFVSGGSYVFDLTGAMSGSGSLVLGTSAMTLRFNGTSGDGGAIFNLGAGTGIALVRNTDTTSIVIGGLSGGAETQLQGDSSSGGKNMTYTIGGANEDTEFQGVIANGSVGTATLVKTGTGQLTLTGASTYSGGTTISGGVLQVNNVNGSGTGTNIVMVTNGGALGGNGKISGAVTVSSGGDFMPGNPLGTLTISNNLTLDAGSTTFAQVGHSPLTNNAVKTTGTLTEGGLLNVSNIGAVALAAGDTFKLFNAATYAGSFNGVVLPPLTGNLAWNTNSLANSGSLSVVALTSPAITGFEITGANLTISGSGGATNWPYFVEASTNLASGQWTPVTTNQFDSSGDFSITLTNAIESSQPRTFFRLQVP
jgi:autotransporter-associated beta strand protein